MLTVKLISRHIFICKAVTHPVFQRWSIIKSSNAMWSPIQFFKTIPNLIPKQLAIYCSKAVAYLIFQ